MAENTNFLTPLREAGFYVSWVSKVPEVDVAVERDEALERLWPHHLRAALEHCEREEYFWRCEQVHGNLTVPVEGEYDEQQTLGADGLCTDDPATVLGMYVADCGAIYIGDPVKKAVAVVHSGRVGTEKNIIGGAIQTMRDTYGSVASDLIVILAPCIRPPAYEVDFSGTIREQALSAGVQQQNYYDCGICTTSDPHQYYSYRQEQGKTGRMLALISI